MNRLAFALALTLAASASMAQQYNLTINSQQSSATWDASVAAPFQTGTNPGSGLPWSYFIGNYDATNNPTGTRTIPGIFGGDTSVNVPIAISAGGLEAAGDDGGTPLRPAGSFSLILNPGDGEAQIAGLSVDFLNGATMSVAADVSITYSSFRTRQPTCLIIGGIPLTLPLGTVSITSLTATQVSAGPGDLSPTGPGTYMFSVPAVVEVAAAASFAGQDIDVPAVEVPVVLVGNATVSGQTLTVTGGVSIDVDQSQPGPTQLPTLPFTEPICSGNLLLNVALASVGFAVDADASIVASGDAVPTGCDSIDFNRDGLYPDNFDLVDFLSVFAGGNCTGQPTGAPPCNADIDFNNDGLFPDNEDIFSFFRVFGGGDC